MTRDLRIGIDVGGTHTDAVVLDSADHVVAWTKRHTSADVSSGIEVALGDVLDQLGDRSQRVGQVMLGTTHGINAILERRGLAKVAAIRLGAPATTSVPPLISWPADLRQCAVIASATLPGGNYVSGGSIQDVDRQAIREFLERAGEETESVAITGVFSPAYRDQELQAAEIVRDVLGPDVGISLSHEIGSLGLLARENAAVLNASLRHVAREVATALREILDKRGIDAPTYFAQNDGTLMGVDQATKFPVLTIGSGPANSIRGAAYLTGLTDALIADVGGTSTDFGVLVGGYPREASLGAELAGVKTNFRMPDVLSISVGGGTVVRNRSGEVTVGPESVGFGLATEGLCFGGDTPTLTDAAVLAGRGEVGSVRPSSKYGRVLREALAIADEELADAVESMNASRDSNTMVVVGGAGFVVPETHERLPRIIRPKYGSVANAVGVAIAPVSSRWDTVIPSGHDRRQAISEASDIATSRAIQAGADPSRVDIIEITETPVGYLPQPATRLRVRAAGPLGHVS
ncbi:hydantoinase/oxoprolinase family protein [Rhodococcus sp. JS3073]|uniref:hydantoinase/oxoprolinase family protein n=1 Tax=Rhodococcus sp. JS3073 TaxID=3002901 RepID=UPI0022865BB2|nr:hydantoinase/oxoprolinase family protein [Rhodococcus sp. JS3073]WAM12085.1 hydantoinase/oxoprolinase family protein [Rhodococcus sp. JS3073]